MDKIALKNILSKLSETKWCWSYVIENEKGSDSGHVNVIYANGSLSIRWDEDKLNEILGGHPPLSLTDREVVDYKDKQIIITYGKWKIYLDID